LERVEQARLEAGLVQAVQAVPEAILYLPQLQHWVVAPVYLDLPTAGMADQAVAVVIVMT
jgi:hypothetical protein